jgi:hypothetical protein
MQKRHVHRAILRKNLMAIDTTEDIIENPVAPGCKKYILLQPGATRFFTVLLQQGSSGMSCDQMHTACRNCRPCNRHTETIYD